MQWHPPPHHKSISSESINLKYKIKHFSNLEFHSGKRVILSSSLDFYVTYHKIHISCSGHASVVLAAPVFKVDPFKIKWGKVSQRKKGANWAPLTEFWQLVLLFCDISQTKTQRGSLFTELQKVKVTFKLVPFVPILFSYTVAPFNFETSYLF